MDDFDPGSPPHCPEDDVVMREISGGWECPYCGHVRQSQDDVDTAVEFGAQDEHDG